MAPIRSIPGVYNSQTGTIKIMRGDLYGTAPAFGLRGRLGEIEHDPFVFSEKHGLRPRKRLSQQQIKYLRMSMPAANTCIDYIKNRMLTFPFRIVKTTGNKKHNNLSSKRAERVEKLFKGPNQFGKTYRMRLSEFSENLLERDLGVLEKEVYPAGGIKQWGVIESSKVRPNPKNYQGDLSMPAYFEFDSMLLETIVNEYRADEITWANLNPQAGSFYGLAPLEVLDMIIMTSIYANRHNLKQVHPNSEKGGGIIYLGNVGTETRKEFETRYAIMRQQDPGRPMFTSGGDTAPQYLNLRDKTDMDYPQLSQSLAEITASCFQLNLRAIGISPKGGGDSAAEIEDMIAQRSAIIPRMLMMQDIFTVGLVHPAGGDDLAIEYLTKKEESLDVRVRAASMSLGRGIMTLDECRDMIDETLEKYEPGIGDQPFIISGNNLFKVEDFMKGKLKPEPEVIEVDRNGNEQNNDNNNNNGNGDNNGNKNFKRTTGKQTERGAAQNW